MAERRCRHGREGTCPYCLARVPADDYWQMVRFLNELHHTGKRKKVRDAS